MRDSFDDFLINASASLRHPTTCKIHVWISLDPHNSDSLDNSPLPSTLRSTQSSQLHLRRYITEVFYSSQSNHGEVFKKGVSLLHSDGWAAGLMERNLASPVFGIHTPQILPRTSQWLPKSSKRSTPSSLCRCVCVDILFSMSTETWIRPKGSRHISVYECRGPYPILLHRLTLCRIVLWLKGHGDHTYTESSVQGWSGKIQKRHAHARDDGLTDVCGVSSGGIRRYRPSLWNTHPHRYEPFPRAQLTAILACFPPERASSSQ